MQRVLRVVLTVCAMLLVATLAALISLRLAIHGREVVMPDFAGLSDADSAASARMLGLNLSVENRFYSASVLPNHVLSQAPAPGVRVRRGWQVRVTESLGAQRVAVPDLIGESERPAQLMLSHLQLSVAPEAYLPASGQPGVVIAQSPMPHTMDATGPRISLLVSGEPADPASFAFVMPRLTGMHVGSAMAFLGTAGLHLTSVVNPAAPPLSTLPGLIPVPVRPTINPTAVIATQAPAAGSRVTRADAIRVTIGELKNP